MPSSSIPALLRRGAQFPSFGQRSHREPPTAASGAHKTDYGVEPICRVLAQAGVQIAPSTNDPEVRVVVITGSGRAFCWPVTSRSSTEPARGAAAPVDAVTNGGGHHPGSGHVVAANP